ncbi:carbamoyltransferase HypF [Horticoccus sp. 23ND18S-11]|uniref:carbamoyltransferase HypF n=1 Tax=Horticoccus sp. 23ND18S-11 TaxID=3391832 RepID=UPI0039C8F1A1
MPVTEQATDIVLRVRGTVQGVGFRPFVHRLATGLALRGWVRNDRQGVLIRLVGPGEKLETFERALRDDLPPAAHVLTITEQPPESTLPDAGPEFTIIESDTSGPLEATLPPDLAVCAACRGELNDPADRRFRYPFINCTQCGPRYSIIEALPYDRPHTTMRAFRMCPACQAEYETPASRRFHAQPNACATCGPRVHLTDATGIRMADDDEAIRAAAQSIATGQIVAVKGLGGYHLLVDATSEAAVATLRRRKHRDEKPFAVMFADLTALAAVADVSAPSATLLASPAAPIVLVPRRAGAALALGVAPGNPWIGAFLASTPLHVLLLQAIGRPVVATSANLADEPLCTSEEEARRRLAGIADQFLHHDRPVAHPVDDSVVRHGRTASIMLRRARGYAPTTLPLPGALAGHWLCVGAQMKATVAVASDRRVVLSPHIGDLGGAATAEVFRRTAAMLRDVHGGEFTAVVCDKHPDYSSTRFAQTLPLPRVAVQHHLAHVLACLLEHQQPADDVLGVSWDGTGYGEDGTVWGGEFLLLRRNTALRFGRLHPFRLPGGDAAARDPRRVALSLLQAAGSARYDALAHDFGFSPDDARVLRIMLGRGLNAPMASSAGRLFDAVGALLGLGHRNHFEGQTPLAVEAAAMAAPVVPSTLLPLPLQRLPACSGAVCELDWRLLIDALLAQSARGVERVVLAQAFHHALASGIVAMAREAGVRTVALSGGCFQNALLLDLATAALHANGFTVLTHRELPPNDGNIAAGQALGALWNLTSVALP